MANEVTLIPVSDVERMAAAISKSGLFGIKTVEQAMALMLVAQAEGRHPASVAMEFHIIQGRPALKADAMLSRFQSAGGSVKWSVMTDERVAGVFTHPQGGSVEIDWDMRRAKAAQLVGKEGGMWTKYPRQMLRARVISEGVRACFPGATGGFYVPEEVQQFEPAKPAEKVINPVANAIEGNPELPADQMDALRELASVLVQMVETDGNPKGAYMYLDDQHLDQEQTLNLWLLLKPNSKTRAALKKEAVLARGASAPVEANEHIEP
jgi:hypothetical protein